jgi:hypothetical protein
LFLNGDRYENKGGIAVAMVVVNMNIAAAQSDYCLTFNVTTFSNGCTLMISTYPND